MSRSTTKGGGCALVAAGHAEVAGAARQILEAGGNAFDAVIAAGMASALAEPGLTSLGGGGFLLARTADGRSRVYDFFVDTPGRGAARPPSEPALEPVTIRFPASEQVFHVGPGSSAVPGTLAGYLHVHERLGRLPLADVVAPAVGLARDGIVVNRWQGYILGLLEPIMTMHPDGRRLFAPSGRYVAEGDRLHNPDLADFLLELPAVGASALYDGSRAVSIAADMAATDGLLTVDDLAAYRVAEREPLSVEYRGFELLTNPPPSFGGSLLALSLRLLNEASPADAACKDDPARYATIVAVMLEVERLRADGVYAPADLDRGETRRSVERVRTASGGTTHVSVCDVEGNVASMTTSNGEGSGYFVPGTGIMLNNMMGEDDLHPGGFHSEPAGRRVASMMSPSVLLDGDTVRLVLGSGGSKRIRTALLQVISAVIDRGADLVAAVGSPRMHWDGSVLQVEPGFAADVVRAVEKRWPVNRWPVLDVYFGGVHAVVPGGEAAGDPRRGGGTAVVR